MRAAWICALGKVAARLFLASALAAACQFASAAPAGQKIGPGPIPKILGVRFGGEVAGTRMVIESDGALSTRILSGPGEAHRIVIDLVRLDRSSSDPAPRGDGVGLGLVRSWRIDSSRGGYALVLDLTNAGHVAHRFVLPPMITGAPFRYVIDIARPDASSPKSNAALVLTGGPVFSGPPGARQGAARPIVAAASATQDATPDVRERLNVDVTGDAPAGRSSHAVVTRHGRKVIVIDAGHGGHDPGAQAASLNEKDITLATALELRRRLVREGGYKVVMTRDSDVFISLETRVQIARHAGADLFISLHADSAGSDPDRHGASIYTLSDHGETRVNEVLGPREWFSRPGSRAADQAVSRILLDLTQRSTLNRSAQFASLLIDRVSDKIDLLPRTHRDAGYYVLLAPDVPAVLMEMGFISSPRDQARLTDPTQRGKLAAAIIAAIDSYFGQPSTRPTAPHRTHGAVEASVMTPSPILSPTQAG